MGNWMSIKKFSHRQLIYLAHIIPADLTICMLKFYQSAINTRKRTKLALKILKGICLEQTTSVRWNSPFGCVPSSYISCSMPSFSSSLNYFALPQGNRWTENCHHRWLIFIISQKNSVEQLHRPKTAFRSSMGAMPARSWSPQSASYWVKNLAMSIDNSNKLCCRKS